MQLYHEIYCDYDGVLVNFHQGVIDLTGAHFKDGARWKNRESKFERNKLIECAGVAWWANLPPMPDYDDLWGFIEAYQPHILTATPSWKGCVEITDYAFEGKTLWNEKYTKVPEDRFHMVSRESKRYYARHQAGSNILIDDYEENIKSWTKAGGIAILHTSARDTIEKLIELGF